VEAGHSLKVGYGCFAMIKACPFSTGLMSKMTMHWSSSCNFTEGISPSMMREKTVFPIIYLILYSITNGVEPQAGTFFSRLSFLPLLKVAKEVLPVVSCAKQQDVVYQVFIQHTV
jgi:hypothetical protein